MFSSQKDFITYGHSMGHGFSCIWDTWQMVSLQLLHMDVQGLPIMLFLHSYWCKLIYFWILFPFWRLDAYAPGLGSWKMSILLLVVVSSFQILFIPPVDMLAPGAPLQCTQGLDADSCSESFIAFVDLACLQRLWVAHFMWSPSTLSISIGCASASSIHNLFQLFVLFNTLK